ncbi:VOC family protein [Thermocrispum agreste]|uniref:VOC family protein n=1 Tax=Thermocrispum agreste TaxID=37925 RepID=UPI0004271FCC|nr:VOC family protein [Thermocrispum agreste]
MPKPIPDDYPRVIASLTVRGAADAIDFYTEIFGGRLHSDPMTAPDGTVAHAEIRIGDSMIMLGEESPVFDSHAPQEDAAAPVRLMVYVEDADETVRRAVERGARQEAELRTEFYGDRGAAIRDPFGHAWYVASHVEDVSPEEIDRRAHELFTT